ncbi:hypothetical protein V8F33_011643, partial [Rhypophila sp. PSN 637]
LWIVINDTVYEHRDLGDGMKAGIKGIAVALLAFVGRWNGFSGVWYFGLVVGGTRLAQGWFVWAVDLRGPKSCGMWFKRQVWMVGLPGILGLAGEYYFGKGK